MSALPSHARVVVIGGGVVNCSILYHLAKKGWRDLLLLAYRELSCGSSWHAAGQFHIINANANLSALQLATLKFYPQLKKESGQSIGLHCFVNVGKLSLSKTPSRRVTLKIDAAAADANGDEPVYRNNKNIGHVTSGGYGHFLQTSLAIAYVGVEHAGEGAQCEVEILGCRRPATVHLQPLYDPEGRKMRG